MNEIVREFEGRKLRVRVWQGRPCALSNDVGLAVGYRDGRALTNKVMGEWAREFIEGVDFVRLKGSALKAFFDSTDSVESSLGHGGTRTAIALYESGIYLALLKTRKPAGIRLRRFLATDVLPELARTGSYTAPSAPSPPAPAVERTAELRRRERFAARAEAILAKHFADFLASEGHRVPSEEWRLHLETALGDGFDLLSPSSFTPTGLRNAAARFRVVSSALSEMASELDLFISPKLIEQLHEEDALRAADAKLRERRRIYDEEREADKRRVESGGEPGPEPANDVSKKNEAP